MFSFLKKPLNWDVLTQLLGVRHAEKLTSNKVSPGEHHQGRMETKRAEPQAVREGGSEEGKAEPGEQGLKEKGREISGKASQQASGV